MQVSDIIRRSARRFGDAPAIVSDDREISFLEFDAATDRLGNALLRQGLAPGDRVALLLPNGIDALLVYYGLAKAGLVRVALNTRDTPEDHAFRVADSQARALITYGPSVGAVEWTFGIEELHQMVSDGPRTICDVRRGPEEPYRIAYTGGTTGRSKGVVLTERGEQAEIIAAIGDLVPGIRPGDKMLHAAPVIHGSGAFFLPHLVSGACQIVMEKFETGPYLEALERTRAERTFLVPTMIAMIVDEPNIGDVDTSALKALPYTASPISPTLAERAIEVFGPVLCQSYGQTEAPLAITYLSAADHDRVGSAGRPYTWTEVRVVDEADNEVPRGELGEVVARGQILMKEYWNLPEQTAETLRGGWLHTGDIGYLDDQDYLYLLDRRNDMIITGGYNVYPREVEDVLAAHPAVREVAVVSVPDQKWGEVVHAVVSTRSVIDEAELLAYAAERLSTYKRPRVIEVWEDLPKSSVGKVLRRSVRDQVRADA